jgi:hypothetical protein
MKLLVYILILPIILNSQQFTRGIFGQNYWEYPNLINAGTIGPLIGWSNVKVVG